MYCIVKTIVLYILLLTYATNLVKPVLPYIKDAVAHIFWYTDHLSSVHYENGKYHVHLEALREAKKTDNSKATVPGKAQQIVSEHMISRFDYQFIALSSPVQFVLAAHYPLRVGFAGSHKIPPRLTV